MLQEEVQERNQYLFEQKKKKQENGGDRYKNLSEEEKKCQYHRD